MANSHKSVQNVENGASCGKSRKGLAGLCGGEDRLTPHLRRRPSEPDRKNLAEREQELACEPGRAASKAAYCSGVIAATSHSSTAHTLAERGLPSKKDCSPSTEPAPTRVRGPMLKPSPE
jgi:hypothetical protein